MSDLVGNPEDWFSHNEARMATNVIRLFKEELSDFGLHVTVFLQERDVIIEWVSQFIS